ncbi:hypothetical protein C770_GR4pC0149 (plasmid) [Sinorhizobium meliloti GR4]|nr:hypothetical protein C770_GR4pC0149 [Sinorhizobium meliloti GR4]
MVLPSAWEKVLNDIASAVKAHSVPLDISRPTYLRKRSFYIRRRRLVSSESVLARGEHVVWGVFTHFG